MRFKSTASTTGALIEQPIRTSRSCDHFLDALDASAVAGDRVFAAGIAEREVTADVAVLPLPQLGTYLAGSARRIGAPRREQASGRPVVQTGHHARNRREPR